MRLTSVRKVYVGRLGNSGESVVHGHLAFLINVQKKMLHYSCF